MFSVNRYTVTNSATKRTLKQTELVLLYGEMIFSVRFLSKIQVIVIFEHFIFANAVTETQGESQSTELSMILCHRSSKSTFTSYAVLRTGPRLGPVQGSGTGTWELAVYNHIYPCY